MELNTDLADLTRDLSRPQTSSALRRLTRVTAQMAGLMFLTLIELNQRTAARSWARTARVAADEAGDPTVIAWVRAQEAYVHYYSGHLDDALDIARRAQDLAGRTGCVAAPLAAALEARALAALGQGRDARIALERAASGVADLDLESQQPSAFGYNEAQLRFHEGNAYTHLRDTRSAWTAQERALELYPDTDYLDRTLVQLDRANCLVHDGDVSTAAAHASQTLLALTDQQRTAMIMSRGQQIFESLDRTQRALPAAQEFREVLMVTDAEERSGQHGVGGAC